MMLSMTTDYMAISNRRFSPFQRDALTLSSRSPRSGLPLGGTPRIPPPSPNPQSAIRNRHRPALPAMSVTPAPTATAYRSRSRYPPSVPTTVHASDMPSQWRPSATAFARGHAGREAQDQRTICQISALSGYLPASRKQKVACLLFAPFLLIAIGILP